MVLLLISCISLCLIGGGLFGTGMVLAISPLVATGIALIVVAIIGLLVDYIFCKKEAVRVHNPIAYSTNNMNTMKRNHIIAEGNNIPTNSAFSTKRNKSDTDLELINRQSEEANIV
jgi:hypothetical protein